MDLFHRSTRSIVAGKRPAAQDKGWQQPDGAGLIPPPEDSQETQERAAEVSFLAKCPKWLLPAAAGVTALVVGVILLIILPGGSAKAPAEPEALSGQAIVSVQADTALTEQALAGDVVRIYGEDGQPVPELQYVQVYKPTDGALLLLMDDAQASALVRQSNVPKVVLVVHNDAQRAAELLELQSRINDPEITLTLRSAVSMAPGEALELSLDARIQPQEAALPEVEWASSDPEVATVAGGTVTAGQVGRAVISARCGGVEAQCEVTVIDLRLSASSVTLGIGEETQVTADAGEFAVSWDSADPEVATVAEDGTVTGVAPGKTVVTATSEDVSVTCQVTVGYRAEVAQLDSQNLTLTVGQTAVLTPTTYPGTDVIDTGAFSSSDPTVLTVAEDGTVTAAAEGTAIVTYQCGAAQASCTVKVEKP